MVNILVGFAPLKPAEFVVLKLAKRSISRRASPRRCGSDGAHESQHQPVRSLSDLSVQGEMGRPVRRRLDQDGRPQADDRDGRVPRGGREHHEPQAARQNEATAGVTLEAGVTYDTAFEDWANLVNDFASHSITSLGEFRKNITVDVFNEAGQKAISYNLYRCWVSEYQALPDLDAGANAVAITTIKLEYEWFERDRVRAPSQGPARIG